MCRHLVKNFLFVIRHVSDQYKPERMCDKAVVENDGMIKFVPHGYKDQKMFYRDPLIHRSTGIC